MNKRSAFTLIELLVVMLIIGILVAVAVPQYKRAVLKVRWGYTKAFMIQVLNEQQLYKLENGEYAVDLLELPSFEGWRETTSRNYVSADGLYRCLNANHEGMEFMCNSVGHRKAALVVFFDNPTRSGNCKYNTQYRQEREICQAVGAACPAERPDWNFCPLLF